jgi:uncharacterized protein with GYD domain
MPTYVMLTRLTDEGAKTIKSHPERILEVDKEMEAFGLKVVYQLAVLGKYDFVNIVEAPDNIAVARASIELGRRGTLRIETLPAIGLEEFVAQIRA